MTKKKGSCGGPFCVIKHKNEYLWIMELLLTGKIPASLDRTFKYRQARHSWRKKANKFTIRVDNYHINDSGKYVGQALWLDTSRLDAAKRVIRELRQYVPTWKKDEIIELFHDSEHKKDSTVALGN